MAFLDLFIILRAGPVSQFWVEVGEDRESNRLRELPARYRCSDLEEGVAY